MRPLCLPPPPFNVVWLAEVDSTNLMVQRLLDAWEGDGRLGETLVVAGRQWAGRGRGERTWVSPEGGLYATWLGWLCVEALSQVPMAAAVALAEALEAAVPGLVVGCKWPNDLVVGGKKLGGILCQARVAGREAAVVVGFGANLAVRPKVPMAVPGPTCVADWGWSGDAAAAALGIAVDCATRLRQRLQQPAGVWRVWAQRSIHRPGDELLVRVGREEVRGRFVGFGEAGQLRLQVAGQAREFLAADVVAPL